MPDSPVIVEVAVNGATRSVNPHVPLTPAEVADEMPACVARGGSIAHDHHEAVFVPDGVHPVEPSLEAWAPVLAQHPDVLLYATVAAHHAATQHRHLGHRPATPAGTGAILGP